MMPQRRMLAAALLVLAACARTEAPAPAAARPDVDYAEPIVLLADPDSLAIEQMKQRMGDDFYVVADDAMWYRALALELLDSLQMPYADAPRDSASFLVDGKPALVRWADMEMAWFAIVYDGVHAPTITADADLRSVLIR